MQVEMEVKKATVDLEIEQEELQSKISERESVPGEVIPALVPELSPHTPPLRVHLPPDDSITASKALKIDHEVSSASIISQSSTSFLYKPLPTPNSQPKDIVRETLLKVDANDLTPHANKKLRYRNHVCSFKNEWYKHASELSKYIRSLKDKSIPYNIKWRKVKQARSYSNISKRCNLCLWEKCFII